MLGWGINKVPFASLCGKNTSQIIQNWFKQRFNISENRKSNITNTCFTQSGSNSGNRFDGFAIYTDCIGYKRSPIIPMVSYRPIPSAQHNKTSCFVSHQKKTTKQKTMEKGENRAKQMHMMEK